jgi:hypothetical protein
MFKELAAHELAFAFGVLFVVIAVPMSIGFLIGLAF